MEQRAALHRCSAAPLGLSLAGRGDRAVRVFGRGGRHRGDEALVLRIRDLPSFPACGIDPPAADINLPFADAEVAHGLDGHCRSPLCVRFTFI
jgi:hypothetical protein